MRLYSKTQVLRAFMGGEVADYNKWATEKGTDGNIHLSFDGITIATRKWITVPTKRIEIERCFAESRFKPAAKATALRAIRYLQTVGEYNNIRVTVCNSLSPLPTLLPNKNVGLRPRSIEKPKHVGEAGRFLRATISTTPVMSCAAIPTKRNSSR